MAAVLRQIDAPRFYKWERNAKAGARFPLDARDAEIERLKAELTRKRELIAEIAEENLTLKRGYKSAGTHAIQGGAAAHRAPLS